MMDGVSKKYEDAICNIQKLMLYGNYDDVVKDCGSLFEDAFKRIYSETLAHLTNVKDKQNLIDKEKEIAERKNVTNITKFTWGEIYELFRETGVIKTYAKVTGKSLGLLEYVDYGSAIALRNNVTHNGFKSSRADADTIFTYAKGLCDVLGFCDVEKAIKAAEPEQVTIVDGEEFEKVNIALNREKGIIINQSDKSRNISYKVETINNMLTVVYNKTKELAGEEEAEAMLFDMGYDGGNKFGHEINKKWNADIAKKNMTYEDKLENWCDFDSEVGWGRFSSSLVVDEEEEKIDGILEIKDNFLCYERKSSDVKLCNFMKGYCEGVIEELLGGTPVTLVCTGEQCPLKSGGLNKKKSRKNSSCQFRVEIVEDEE